MKEKREKKPISKFLLCDRWLSNISFPRVLFGTKPFQFWHVLTIALVVQPMSKTMQLCRSGIYWTTYLQKFIQCRKMSKWSKKPFQKSRVVSHNTRRRLWDRFYPCLIVTDKKHPNRTFKRSTYYINLYPIPFTLAAIVFTKISTRL